MTETTPIEEQLLEFFGKDQDLIQLQQPGPDQAPNAIRTVAVVGGGTAGYFAALLLRKHLPWLEITLIESKRIPIIGVGEATTPPVITFLHKALGIDIHDFYRQLKPVWKLGIRFEWGLPEPYHFNAPFDWDTGDIGLLGSLAYTDSINSMCLQSLMMDHNKVPIVLENDSLLSLLHSSSFAYHLDNGTFVAYLHGKAMERGIRHIDTTVVDAEVNSDGTRIASLVTETGERLSFDFYVDCSGFRSLLLEGKLKVPFISYDSSLATDRALAFNNPHHGLIKPYTTAITMNSGWCWQIPMLGDNHLGYVFSSSFCKEEDAEAELRAKFPEAGQTRLVKFRSGRHAEMWRGNVFAVGNSYAFVEPLESSGILMITTACAHLAYALARSHSDERHLQAMVNESVAKHWDSLRWFLAIHYRFNRRLDTEFWRYAREKTDVSGVEPLIELFRERAPLRLRGPDINAMLTGKTGVFYELGGFDSLLLGQKVPTKLIAPNEKRPDWESRRAVAARAVDAALTMSEALEVATSDPSLLDEFMNGESWTNHPNTWFANFRV